MRHYKTLEDMKKLDDRKGRDTVCMPPLRKPKPVSLFRKLVNLLLFRD